MKVVIFATHPIQYHIPWFRELSKNTEIEILVYYGCFPDAKIQGTGFDEAFEWDIPLLEGYKWVLLESNKETPGMAGFFGNSIKGLGKALRRDKPNAVILTGWQAFPLLQLLFWCVLLGIPRIVRGESSGLKSRSLPVRVIHRLLLFMYNGFLVIGKANQKFYKGYFINDSKMFSCPYFVDNKRLLDQAEDVRHDRTALRNSWNIAPSKVCFLYMGKLIEKKRILDQLAALERSSGVTGNVHLLIAGTGELMEEAKKMASERQLPVTFAGFLNQTEITRAYVAADCLILSSDYDETWGLVVNEAMICGLPAIVSDRAGCGPDLVNDGVTGFIYPFGNIHELSERMLWMANNPKAMRQMGENAQKRVLRDYSVEKAVRGTLNSIKYVLN